jgi:hypothetical protein
MNKVVSNNPQTITMPGVITYFFAAVFLYGLFSVSNSPEGAMGFGGLFGLGLIFPFYLVASLFVGRFTLPMYIVLFLISSGFYLVVIYSAALWSEKLLFRRYGWKFPSYVLFSKKTKPKLLGDGSMDFVLKRIKQLKTLN